MTIEECTLSLMGSILDRVKQIPTGTIIPKPEARAEFRVKGWGKRRGEPALVYFIPNRNDPRKPYQKGINLSEWEQAYRQLTLKGEFTREWFNSQMPKCAEEGDCNFTTIGGVFSLLGIAEYSRASYRLRTG